MMSDIVLAGLIDIISILPACIVVTILFKCFNRGIK